MDKKRTLSRLALLTGLIVLFTFIVAGAVHAQGPNLLPNPSFEDGHYAQDNIAEITAPNGWRMHWSNGESNIFEGYAETARPETVVWYIKDGPPSEQGLFWKDGSYVVKIFKGWAPVWAAMSADVSGLEVGRRYRLVAPVFIDIVADYGEGGKIPPEDGRQGRVRLGASPVGTGWRDEANINYSGWWTGETISPFYQAYPTFVHEFTATAADMTMWIEVASNYPHPNNGFFIDTVGLYALDEVNPVAAAAAVPPAPANPASEAPAQPAQPAQVAAAPAAPLPTATPRSDGAVIHTVQSGDTFWSLAIQYAATMGLTPEEALTAIPELNNNPAVITSGDELIIVPPSEEGEEATESDAEPTEEATATEETSAEATSEDAAADGEADEAQEGTEEISGAEGASRMASALPQVSPASICVQVFEDADGDGQRAAQNEPALTDQAVTLSRDGNTLTTYISDGAADMHCFEDLESTTYQVQIFPTSDYEVVGDDSWAVSVVEGVMIPVSFGLQSAPEAVAEAPDAATTPAAEPALEAAAQQEGGGLSSNIVFVALGVAVVLLLVAGTGVYLLRRG